MALTDAAGNVATDYTQTRSGSVSTLGAATANRIGYPVGVRPLVGDAVIASSGSDCGPDARAYDNASAATQPAEPSPSGQLPSESWASARAL